MSAYAVAEPRSAVPASLVIRTQRGGNRIRPGDRFRLPLTFNPLHARNVKARGIDGFPRRPGQTRADTSGMSPWYKPWAAMYRSTARGVR